MELIKSFKALSDKTRLRLLYILQAYELNVNEIVQIVGMIQSGVSRHLKILVESGMLTSRRDSSFIYYSAARHDTAKTLISLINKSSDLEDVFQSDIQKTQEIIRIRKKRTERFFQTMASQWDKLKKEVFGPFDLDLIIKEKILCRGRFADLGCGTGELIEKLSCENCDKLIGIDSSPEMLEQARVRLSKTSKADLRLGELEHLPLSSREIDTSVMNMVLHHISQPQLPIAEAYRVLKPEGIFIIADFEKHDNKKVKKVMGGSWSGFEKEKIKTWIKDAGFHLLSIDAFTVKHQLTINLFVSQKT